MFMPDWENLRLSMIRAMISDCPLDIHNKILQLLHKWATTSCVDQIYIPIEMLLDTIGEIYGIVYMAELNVPERTSEYLLKVFI